jgi:hypothetical protein
MRGELDKRGVGTRGVEGSREERGVGRRGRSKKEEERRGGGGGRGGTIVYLSVQVQQNSAKNKMDTRSLAVIFNPLLLR